MSNKDNIGNNNASGSSNNLIKIKKLKIVKNLPGNLADLRNSLNLNYFNNAIQSANTRNNSLSNKKDQLSSPRLIPASNFSSNKLTFENVFNFKKGNSNAAQNSVIPVLINTNNNGNSTGNINTILSQSSQQTGLPSSTAPIIINNLQQQPQISININNFSINNYNFNSNKAKKSSVNYSASVVNSTPINILNNTAAIKPPLDNLKLITPQHSLNIQNINSNSINTINNPNTNNNNSNFILNNFSQNKSGSYDLKKLNSIANLKEEKNEFIPSFKFKVSKKEFNSNKNTNSKKSSNKIETIIDGNNDSFINELADLLNNVESKDKDKGKDKDKNFNNINNQQQSIQENEVDINNINKLNLDDGADELNYNNGKEDEPEININELEMFRSSNEEIPDPRINFAQLQMVNSKRPQTSYGGLSARQKSLQKSLRQKTSSKISHLSDNKNEELFPMPKNNSELNYGNSIYFDLGLKNKLLKK